MQMTTSLVRILSAALLLTCTAAMSQSDPKDATTKAVGDAARGRLVFAACRTCHYPESYVGHHNGPSLHRIFGRRAGSTDFAGYSEVMKQSQFVWTPALLDYWLAHPNQFLRGSNMLSPPLHDAQQRADLIAYLRQASE